MDGCHPLGAPQAASDILLYDHWKTSCEIIRVDTRPYLQFEKTLHCNVPTDEDIVEDLTDLLAPFLKDDEDFEVRQKFHVNNNSDILSVPKHLRNYFQRPKILFDPETNTCVDGDNLSLTQFSENYITTRKKKKHNEDETFNTVGSIVRPRKPNEKNIIVDLCRVSPPDETNKKWCAGANALKVPHRSIEELFGKTNATSLEDAYAHFKSLKTSDGFAKIPELLNFKHACLELDNAVNRSFELKIEKSQDMNRELPPSSEVENDTMFSVDDENVFELRNDDEDITELTYNHIDDQCKHWNGNIDSSFLTIGEDYKQHELKTEFPIHLNETRLENHKTFLETICSNKDFSVCQSLELETEKVLDYSERNRSIAADRFMKETLKKCKTNCQRKALKLIEDVATRHYFNSSKLNKPPTSPIITIVGIPGSGKSWIVEQIRIWASLRFETTDFPIDSDEHNVQMHSDRDNLAKEVSEILNDNKTRGRFGKVAVLAFTGAAAGLIKGTTIHSGLYIDINTSPNAKKGYDPLPFSEATRIKLLKDWKDVKILIIDEVFTVSAEFLGLQNQRICQIFNKYNKPFANLVVIYTGDPRQIKPVTGKPLYTISKYFEDPTDPNSRILPNVALSPNEYKGFSLYSAATYCAILNQSKRITDPQFKAVNQRIATYTVTSEDLDYCNKLVRSKYELLKAPWIDAPWLYPNWNSINNHLVNVSEIMSKQRGIFRCWAPVDVPSDLPQELRYNLIRSFYKSSTTITAKFTHPLPYIDYFPGQIVNLKYNYSPSWKLYKNAKMRVVGIYYKTPYIRSKPHLTIDEAIEISIHNPKALFYDLLLKPFECFNGLSALDSVPGIIIAPWASVYVKMHCHFPEHLYKTRIKVGGPHIHPANAFTHHQAQGGTFSTTVVQINEKSNTYGMANVVTSRTSCASKFAFTEKVSYETLQPAPHTSTVVEAKYKRLIGIQNQTKL